MLRLIPAVLVFTAIALASAPSVAKEIKTLRKELLGIFHESPEQCRSYFIQMAENRREEPLPHRILNDHRESYYYGPCDGKDCPQKVLNYVVTRNTYVLTLLYQGLYGSHKEKLSITQISQSRFKFRFAGGKPFTLVRCSRTPFEPGGSKPGTR